MIYDGSAVDGLDRESDPCVHLSDGGVGVPKEQACHFVVLRVGVAVERHELVHEGPLL